MVYIMDSTDNFYMSKQTMREFGIIAKDFPINLAQACGKVSDVKSENDDGAEECNCKLHSKPPKQAIIVLALKGGLWTYPT